MPGHLSAAEVERFHQRTLTPAELITTYDHLASCEDCRQLLSQAEQPEIALAGLAADLAAAADARPEHLSYEELSAYVDNRSDEVEREIAGSHLEVCATCAAELRDLQELQATTVGRSAKEYPPLWRRVVAFWQSPQRWVPLQVAATAAVVALLVWTATLSWRTEVADLKAQLGRLQQTDDALRKEASATAALQAELSELQKETEHLRRNYEITAARVEELETRRGGGRGGDLENVVALNDAGGRITIDANGNLSMPVSLTPSHQPAVKAALMTRQVETPPELASIAGRSAGRLRSPGVGVPFALRSPVGTVVETDRPTFRWEPLPGATSYAVVVYDSNFNPVESSQPLAGTEWAAARSQERGRIYSWQVTALKDGEAFKSPTAPAPEAKFKILAQESAREIERARQNYSGSHLVLGVLYAKAGLLDEAEREFAALAESNPNSTAAQKLLLNLRALRQARRRR